jgi:hypothetical protein
MNLQMMRESTLPEWTEREFVLIKGDQRREIKQVDDSLINYISNLPP